MKRYENVQKMSAEQPTRSKLPPLKSLLAPRETQNPPGQKGSATSVKAFVENVFAPTYVELKNGAGRRHYYAILKYILTPESVERISSTDGIQRRGRLKSKMNWPYLDNVRLCDLTADTVRQLISCASSEGYSPQTLKHIRNVVGAIIKVAKRERVFNGDNPISDVELPTMIRRECHNLTIDQAKTILKVMKYPQREAALLTICTGLGVSDICALRWKHVNLTHAHVFRNGIRIPARSIMVGKLTRANAFRPVQQGPQKYTAISETLAAVLMKLRRPQRPENHNDFLLTAPDGGPQSSLNLQLLGLGRLSKELQMPWLSWLVLKHAHRGLIEELRRSLTDQLVAHAFWALLD